MPDGFRAPSYADEFLTVAEVADLLKLNPQTVRNWIEQGRLPAVRVGRRVRITRLDLDEVIEHGLLDPTQPGARTDGDAFWAGGTPHAEADIPEAL